MVGKREHERIDCKVRVFVGADVFSGRIFFDAMDISVGGLYLSSEFMLEEGDMVKVAFQLPGEAEPFVLAGGIKWVNLGNDPEVPNKRTGMGVEFLNLETQDRERLQRYIQERRKGDGGNN